MNRDITEMLQEFLNRYIPNKNLQKTIWFAVLWCGSLVAFLALAYGLRAVIGSIYSA